jgi:hypothetical protein
VVPSHGNVEPSASYQQREVSQQVRTVPQRSPPMSAATHWVSIELLEPPLDEVPPVENEPPLELEPPRDEVPPVENEPLEPPTENEPPLPLEPPLPEHSEYESAHSFPPQQTPLEQ